MLLNFEDIRNNEEILTYLKFSDDYFASMGYKEHGLNHALHTAERAADVLRQLGYTARTQELAKIAGFLHDIGNLVGRRVFQHTVLMNAARMRKCISSIIPYPATLKIGKLCFSFVDRLQNVRYRLVVRGYHRC